MIDLKQAIARIEAQLRKEDAASLTYAALEARLALERVCYDRLRQCHDYISFEDLQRWQPANIVKQLITDVDQNASQTFTLSISTEPADGRRGDEYDYVQIGQQIGINPSLIAKLWNGLSNLALHMPLPKTPDDELPEFGDAAKIEAKVREALAELKRLSKTSMTTSGFGPEVRFNCECGALNKRRLGLLRHGQEVSCINPNCEWSWIAHKNGESFDFSRAEVNVKCPKCLEADALPFRGMKKMKFGQIAKWICPKCSYENQVRLAFAQIKPASAESASKS